MAKSSAKSESKGGWGEVTRNVGGLAVGIGILALVAAGLSELSFS